MDWDLFVAAGVAVLVLEASTLREMFFVVGSFEEWKNGRADLLNWMFVQPSCDFF